MRSRVRLRPAISEEQWADALSRFHGATAFHEWAWLETYSLEIGAWFEPLLAYRGSELVGLIPQVLVRRGPFWSAAELPFPFVGPLTEPSQLSVILRALLRWGFLHRVLVHRSDLRAPTEGEITAIGSCSTQVVGTRTWVVDTASGKSAMHAGFNRNTRRALKMSNSLGVVVRAATADEVVQVLPAVLEDAYAARHQPNPYAGLTNAAWRRVLDAADTSYLAAAFLDGRSLGALVTLVHRDTAFHWVGGCLREHRETRANFLLHVHVLDWALESGYATTDLVGDVDEGVGRFKAGFGARGVPFVIASQGTIWWKLGDVVRRGAQAAMGRRAQ